MITMRKGKFRSREDETYSTFSTLSKYGHANTDAILYEIAISLGRIADMLTDVRHVVEYDSENEGDIIESE